MNDADHSVMQVLVEAIINMHRQAYLKFPELGETEHIRIANITNGIISKFMRPEYRSAWIVEMNSQMAVETGPRPASLIVPPYYKHDWR